VNISSRSPFDLANEAVSRIRQLRPFRPELAIVLGSGLGSAMKLDAAVEIPYGEIPHFPMSTVPGHAGSLYLQDFEGVPTAFLSGRVHLYEGYDPDQVVFAVRVMRILGANTLILTNAAGGVNRDFHPGALMVIQDHINLTGRTPLLGPNDDRLGPRFPDMSEIYSQNLVSLAHASAKSLGQEVVSGVYLGLLGPSFETPAEIHMARLLGVDAVGMSTVLEAVAGTHAGMDVLGISCITNMAAGILPQKLSHEEVIETTRRVRDEFAGLVRAIVSNYAKQLGAKP
jgi:purine-nucleoside phosphorylase